MWGTEIRLLLALAAVLVGLSGCDVMGDDDEPDQTQRTAGTKAVEGTFVGRLRGTDALVAVVAPPAQKGSGTREISVFACDGKDVCEWLAGSSGGNAFDATSSDGDSRARGTLTRASATGSIELAGGEAVDYTATRATAAAGLYTLEVSGEGRVEGASAGGVGLSGRSTLPRPGPGTLRLADGTRMRFRAVPTSVENGLGVNKGEARLIVLPGGRLTGAGSDYYLRSSR